MPLELPHYDDLLTVDFLQQHYIDEKMSFFAISKMLREQGKNIVSGTIAKYADKLGIKRVDGSFLTEEMIEKIDGMLLSRGRISCDGKKARIVFNKSDLCFVKYMMDNFSCYGLSDVYPSYEIRTKYHSDLCIQYQRWYGMGADGKMKKIMPEDIRLGKTSLLFWYLGNGEMIKSGCEYFLKLGTLWFGSEAVDKLVVMLNEIGISCRRIEDDYIYTDHKGSVAFFDLIGHVAPFESVKSLFDVSLDDKNIDGSILRDKTIREEGFDPNTIGRSSNRYIWATCKICGEPNRVMYSIFCKKNETIHRACYLSHQDSPFNREDVREKARQTNLERYGSVFASQNKEIAQKISDEKKGKPLNFEYTQEIQDKITQTNMERYGCKAPLQNKEIQEKAKLTNLERYGCENPLQNEDIKEKSRQTNLKKYGFANPLQNEEIKKKADKTNLDKYGYICSLQNSEVKERSKATMIELYGVEHPLQNQGLKDIAIQSFKNAVEENTNGWFNMSNALRGDDFWKAMKEEKLSINELCDRFNINRGSLGSRLLSDEFRQKYNDNYSYPKLQKQKEIKDMIESLGFTEILFNTKQIISPYELDIYVPEKKFAIEFNGVYWHSEAILDRKEARNKHRDKLDLCRKNGVRLFTLFENIWQDRKTQVFNFIKTILGKNTTSIYARKCIIDNEECPSFIDEHHIQGSKKLTVKYFTLKHEGEIVGSMTASPHHRQNSDSNAIVLSRLCFKDGYNVVGGSSKLFSAFMKWSKESGYSKIISWSDNCYTEGNIYDVLGFKMTDESRPDYFYWDSNSKKCSSKQSKLKQKTGCPDNITERDFCMSKGLYRIWDCGKKKFEYVI